MASSACFFFSSASRLACSFCGLLLELLVERGLLLLRLEAAPILFTLLRGLRLRVLGRPGILDRLGFGVGLLLFALLLLGLRDAFFSASVIGAAAAGVVSAAGFAASPLTTVRVLGFSAVTAAAASRAAGVLVVAGAPGRPSRPARWAPSGSRPGS